MPETKVIHIDRGFYIDYNQNRHLPFEVRRTREDFHCEIIARMPTLELAEAALASVTQGLPVSAKEK